MRALLPLDAPQRELGDDDLRTLYATPPGGWLRANMVSTVDGAAWGSDGLSGSVNTKADIRVFHLLRELADAIVVGAGTARAETYGAAGKPLVLVSNSGEVPEIDGAIAVVPAKAGCTGPDVLVLGEEAVDLTLLRSALAERGLLSLLCEGGPSLLGSLLAARAVDEICTTTTPLVASGAAGRIVHGTAPARDARLTLLLEEHGTLMARWLLE